MRVIRVIMVTLFKSHCIKKYKYQIRVIRVIRAIMVSPFLEFIEDMFHAGSLTSPYIYIHIHLHIEGEREGAHMTK